MRGALGGLGVLVLALAGSGCYAPPPRLDEMSDELVEARATWSEEASPPRLEGRVVLAEFSVELVESKWLMPGPGAAIADPTPFAYLDQVLGIGLRVTEFGEELPRDLPERLAAAFRELLRREGVELLATDELSRCAAFRDYQRAPVDEEKRMPQLQPLGQDTGRLRRTRTVPAPGLAVIEGAKIGSLEGIDRRLCEQMDAERLLRVRLRVGVHRGRASLESGSRIVVCSPTRWGTLRSERSLISNHNVIGERSFLPFRGHLSQVDPERYRTALDALLPVYLGQALRVIRG